MNIHPTKTVLDSLNSAMHDAFQQNESVYLLGEDIVDPYGGAFKVTRGLSTEFPERVWSTPISEAGIVGVAGGMALRGLRPVVEIMFGDFITLAADQLINHVSKFRWMYNDQVTVPMVVRTPMGGRRSYGPTHSQTLEKMFLGVPGLEVLAVTGIGDPGEILKQAILESSDPVLLIENKLLYLQLLQNEDTLTEFNITRLKSDLINDRSEALHAKINAPTYHLVMKESPPPVITFVAYGYMAELARKAVLRLAYEYEIFTELFVPVRLSPFDIEPVLPALRKTGRLLVVEEGTLAMGWGAEVVALAVEALATEIKSSRRVASLNLPIPAATLLEESVLPGVDDIVEASRDIL